MLKLFRKISGFLKILVFILAVSLYFPVPVSYADSPTTMVFGNMTLNATFNSIGIEVKFNGDDERNAAAVLEFKKTSENGWRQGLDLWRVDGADAVPAVDTLGRAFYGSVLLLDSNTSYDIKVTVNDPDQSPQVYEGSITTRENNIPAALSLTPTRFIRSDGSDSNTGTSDSPGGAWKTIQKAILSAPSGAVVQVGPGYYIQATTTRVAPITFKAQYPAVDDDRNIINQGQHSVIEPGAASTGLSTVSCPMNSDDCAHKGVWQRVTGLSAPGLPGDNISAGALLPESVDPNISIWKWTNSPVNSPIMMGYASSRAQEPKRIAAWTIPSNSTINNPAGFIEKLITNKTYSFGFGVFNSGNDIYLRLPPNAPTSDPNELYMTVGGSFGNRAAMNLRGDGSRVTGFEIRNFYDGITISPSGVGSVIDHNLMVGNRSGIYFVGNAPAAYGKNSVAEYNLIKDYNLWTDDQTNKPAIPWNFIKLGIITNADDSNFTIFKPGQHSETVGINGRGGASNTVIRYNTIDGPFNGIVPGYQLGFNRYAGYNYDIHNNLITHIADDAIEPETQSINLKAWNNRVDQTLTFLSTAPVNFGPLYIFRNTAFRVSNAGSGQTNNGLTPASTYFKYSGLSLPAARVFVINNTFWNDLNATVGGGQYGGGNISSERFYLRNNIFRTTHYAFDITANSRDGLTAWNEDYNYFYTSDQTRAFKYNNTPLSDLSLYRTNTNQGAHTNTADVDSSVHTSPDSWLLNPSTGNLAINPAAGAGKLIDLGISVANISDNFTGCAPDLGAFELSSSINCLRNRNFDESNSWAWTIFSNLTSNVKIDTLSPRSAPNSLHFTGTHTNPYSYQDVMVNGGKTYTVSGWVKVPQISGNMSLMVDLQPWKLSATNSYQPIGSATNAVTVSTLTPNWLYFTKSIQLPQDASRLRVNIRVPNLNGEAFADDIILYSPI